MQRSGRGSFTGRRALLLAPTLAILGALLLLPVECGRAAGAHSVFVPPPSAPPARDAPAALADPDQAGHRHDADPVSEPGRPSVGGDSAAPVSGDGPAPVPLDHAVSVALPVSEVRTGPVSPSETRPRFPCCPSLAGLDGGPEPPPPRAA